MFFSNGGIVIQSLCVGVILGSCVGNNIGDVGDIMWMFHGDRLV